MLERSYGMSALEYELINMIRESGDPEQAVMTAIKVFAAFLEQLAEDPAPPSVDLQESA